MLYGASGAGDRAFSEARLFHSRNNFLVPTNEIHMAQDDAKVAKGVHYIPTVNNSVILQSAVTDALAYSGGGFDCMFWLKVNSYGEALTQILIPRLRFYDSEDSQISSFTFSGFNESIADILSSINGDDLVLISPLIPPPGEWHCFRVFYDPADDKVGIQVDNGDVVKSDDGFASPMPNAAKGQCGIWHLSVFNGSAHDFLADELVVKVGGLFTEAQVAAYWNSGVGITYPFP